MKAGGGEERITRDDGGGIVSSSRCSARKYESASGMVASDENSFSPENLLESMVLTGFGGNAKAPMVGAFNELTPSL